MNSSFHRDFFIGPMSKNVVDCVLTMNEKLDKKFGLIPSRRQIECSDLGGGYVEHWDTSRFMNRVGNTLVLRDHSGPMQGKASDDGRLSIESDIKSGLKFIHIDPWKCVKSIEEATQKTLELIRFCLSIDESCHFEVGTESAIFEYSAIDLSLFLKALKTRLSAREFETIVYAVVQSGTRVFEQRNVGVFCEASSREMCRIVHDFGLLSKEHNSDYLVNDEILRRIECGVDSLNIAPEFGTLSSRVIVEELAKRDTSLLAAFEDLCHKSGKWRKWTNDTSITPRKAAILCGHYVFATHDFRLIKKEAGKCLDEAVDKKILANLTRISQVRTST